MGASEVLSILAKTPELEQLNAAIEEAMCKGPITDSEAVWTEHIFKAVDAKKPVDDRIVSYSRLTASKDRGEYLVDLAWSLDLTKEWTDYRGLLLALECEWKGCEEEQWKDFVKLADVRAHRKVFVGALNIGLYDKREELLRRWATHLALHAHTCEHERILVALCEKKDSKAAKHGSWIVDGKGKVTALRAG